tara:strand:- start:284 stop:835 length:552 start_codon:yes stop_codon:yes gene_type:complete
MELVNTISSNKIIKTILFALIGSILLIVSAKIKIPFYPVPMTMQTFVVLFLGISFGYKIAVATVIVYLVEGLLGLPVFSNSPEKGVGLAYFVGPTMGYLIGFFFAAFFAGYLNFKTNLIVIFLKLILSVFFIYLFGIVWLGILIGWEKPIFKLGFFPFIYAELFKILLLTFLTSKFIKIRKFI